MRRFCLAVSKSLRPCERDNMNNTTRPDGCVYGIYKNSHSASERTATSVMPLARNKACRGHGRSRHAFLLRYLRRLTVRVVGAFRSVAALRRVLHRLGYRTGGTTVGTTATAGASVLRGPQLVPFTCLECLASDVETPRAILLE